MTRLYGLFRVHLLKHRAEVRHGLGGGVQHTNDALSLAQHLLTDCVELLSDHHLVHLCDSGRSVVEELSMSIWWLNFKWRLVPGSSIQHLCAFTVKG